MWVWLLSQDAWILAFLDELTVPRYRTEKPSKSPPPPPPRRSFPSSPGITSRSGEPLIPGKSIKVRQRKFTQFIQSEVVLVNWRNILERFKHCVLVNQVFNLPTLASDMLKGILVFVILEVWIWRDWRSEASCEAEEGCFWKPPSCIYAPHTCLRRQGGKRGGQNCCRTGGKLNTGHVLCWFYSLSAVVQGHGQLHSFYHHVMSTVCHWLMRAHALASRHAHHNNHMFKQQVPYVPPAPGTERAQRSHTAQSHTSSLRAHRSQPDRWTLMAAWTASEMACLKFDGT